MNVIYVDCTKNSACKNRGKCCETTCVTARRDLWERSVKERGVSETMHLSRDLWVRSVKWHGVSEMMHLSRDLWVRSVKERGVSETMYLSRVVWVRSVKEHGVSEAMQPIRLENNIHIIITAATTITNYLH